MSTSKLLDHLIAVANKSGAIKPAPHGLKNLKNKIKGVPFQLDVPGMSNVINMMNMLKGIQKLAKQLGGLNNVGDFGNTLGKAAQAAGAKNIYGKTFHDLTNDDLQVLAAHLTLEDLIKIVGDNTALTASLNNFDDDEGRRQMEELAPGGN